MTNHCNWHFKIKFFDRIFRWESADMMPSFSTLAAINFEHGCDGSVVFKSTVSKFVRFFMHYPVSNRSSAHFTKIPKLDYVWWRLMRKNIYRPIDRIHRNDNRQNPRPLRKVFGYKPPSIRADTKSRPYRKDKIRLFFTTKCGQLLRGIFSIDQRSFPKFRQSTLEHKFTCLNKEKRFIVESFCQLIVYFLLTLKYLLISIS